MKNNLFHRSMKSLVLLFFSCLCLFPAFSQVTGTIDTRIFHNTSSTANSLLTYQINLSNGWQQGVSTITSLVLKNSSGTTIHTHSGVSTNYGTVSSSLSPGDYTFSGLISTKDPNNKTVSVNVSLVIRVGYKPEWERILDMSEGTDQYSLKRSIVSSGITKGYAQSHNTLLANTTGWALFSAPNVTTPGSSVYFVFEPLTNPSTFSASDNVTYVEYYYTNSTTKGVRVKAKNSSGVYTIYNLTGVALGDIIRFERDASGNAKLYLNNSTTVLHTFAQTITSEIRLNVHTTLITDLAQNLVTSFGYPASGLPLTNRFDDAQSTGDLTLRIQPVNGFQAPYHYFFSENNIPELKDVYRNLKDSVFGGTLDSTTFFTGPTSGLSFSFRNVPMGHYNLAAFDSRGVRIYSNTYSHLPAMTFTDRSNVAVTYNEYLSCAEPAYVSPSLYMTEQTDGSISFVVKEITKEHAFGVLLPTDAINGGTSSYGKLEAGFLVKNGLVYTIEKGVMSTSSITALKEMELKVLKTGGNLQLIANGSVLKTITLPSVFEYKAGIYLAKWGISLQMKPLLLSKLPFRVSHSVTNNTCSNTGVNLNITFPAVGSGGFHGTLVSARSFQLYSTNPVAAVGTTNQSSFTNLTPGVYKISGTVTFASGAVYNYIQYIYAGFLTSWGNEGNIYAQNAAGMPSTPHAIGNNTVNPVTDLYGQAVGTGILSPASAGWMCFTPSFTQSANNNWINIAMLTEAPQMDLLANPPYNMPAMFFNTGGGMLMLNNPVTQSAQIVPFSPNIPIVARRDNSGIFTLTQNGTQIGNSISGYYFGRWKPSFLIRKPQTGFYKILSDFRCPQSTGQYAHLKYELDGYYHIMKSGEINFVFNQEYSSSNLTFNLYNSNDVLIRTQANFPALSTTNGMNYLTLLVRDGYCIGKGFFYLEVINSKNEKMYLRFFNDYDGCAAIEGENPEGENQ